MTRRQAKTDGALGRSAGWSSPVIVEITFLAIFLSVILATFVFADSTAERVGSVVVLAVAVSIAGVSYSLRLIRRGTVVRVTRRGRYLGRMGTVVEVLPGGTLIEVRLHGVRDNGTTIPSETVELSWFDVKKIFFRR